MAIVVPQTNEDQFNKQVEEANKTLPKPLQFSMTQAADTSPQQFAGELELAEKTNTPVNAVQSNYEAVKRQAASIGYDYEQLKKASPVTAKFLEDEINAKLAHDDVKELDRLEQQYGSWRQFKGPNPSAISIARGLITDVTEGLSSTLSGLKMQGYDLLGAPVSQFMAQRDYEKSQAQIGFNTPAFESSTARGVYGGVSSLLQNAPGLAASIATGNPLPGLGILGVQTQSQAYGKYRSRGASPAEALIGSTGEGAVEVGTELLPMSFLVKNLGRAGFKEFLTGMLGREVPGEQIATFLQDALDTAIANPEATWNDFINSRGERAYETLISTITQSSLMGGYNQLMQSKEQLAEAQTTAAEINDLMDVASEAKLSQRHKGRFKDFLESNGGEDVYISQEALDELLQTHGRDAVNVFEQMPSFEKARSDSILTGQDIALPISEVLTYASKTNIQEELIRHLRTNPAQPSLAELELQQSDLEQTTQFVQEGKNVENPDQASQLDTATEAIQNNISAQLEAAGFEASTAKDTALGVARGIAVMAQRSAPQNIVEEANRIWNEYNLTINQVVGGLNDGTFLEQKDRGQIDLTNRNAIAINLFNNRDLSTVFHESGHFYLEVMSDLAKRSESDTQIKSDFEALAKAFNFDPQTFSGQTIDQKRDVHEKFARSLEGYLLRGEAPTEKLRKVFRRFKEWLKQVYRNVRDGKSSINKELNINLNEEVRSVFDRIFATEQELNMVRNELDFTPMFTNRFDLGMTEDEYIAYAKAAKDEIGQQEENLAKKLIAAETKTRTKEFNDEVYAETKRVQEEVAASQAAQSFEMLTTGEVRLDREELVDLIGNDLTKMLPRGKSPIYTADGSGWNLDSAAGMLGYRNPDDMVDDLLGYREKRSKQYAKNEAYKRVRSRIQDPMVDGSITQEAIDSLHTSKRAERLALEHRAILKAQQTMEGAMAAVQRQAKKEQDYQARWMEAEKNLLIEIERGVNRERIAELRREIKNLKDQAREEKRLAKASTHIITNQEVRQQAIEYLESITLDEIKPYTFLVSERKYSRQAKDALINKDYYQAGRAKYLELLNNHLYAQSIAMQKEAAKRFKRLRSFNKKSVRERIAKTGRAGANHLGQIDNLLISWGLRSPSEGELLANQTLAEYLDEQELKGFNPDIEIELLDTSRVRQPGTLNVNELRALDDAVQSISKLAGMQNTVLDENIQITLAQMNDKLRAKAEASLSKNKRPIDLTTLSAKQKTASFFNGVDAKNLPIRSMVELLDGGETGPWHDYVLNRLYNAGDEYVRFRGEIGAKLDEALQKAFGDNPKLLEDQFQTPFDEFPVSRKYIISVALNLGTQTGYDRVVNSTGLSESHIQEALSHLSKKDLEYVQDVWNILEPMFPRLAEHHIKMGGIAPEKLPARGFSVVLESGETVELQGGYYPLKTDTQLDDRAQVEENKELAALAAGGIIRFATKRGQFKSRVKNSRPILYNFEYVLSRHITEVIKDVTHRAVQIDLQRVLNSPAIKTTINERLSPEHRAAMLEALDAVITDGLIDPAFRTQVGLERIAGKLRGNMAAGMIGYKAGTALVQLVNFTNGVERIGAGWMWRGVQETYGGLNPIGQFMNALEEVNSESPFMSRRLYNIDRDIMDEFRKVNRSKLRNNYEQLKLFGLSMPGYAERIVSVATWKGAKAKGYAEGLRGKALINYADDAVRAAFGSGETVDLTSVTRRQGAVRLMTMFATPLVAQYSQVSKGLRRAVDDPSRIPALINTIILTTVLPGAMIALLKRRGPHECSSDDPMCYARWGAATASASLMDLHYGTRMASSVVESIIKGDNPRDPNISPFVSIANQVVRSNYAIFSELAQGDAPSAEQLFYAFSADATLLGLPGAQQIAISGSFMADLMEGKTSFGEDPIGVLIKKPKER